MIFIFAADRGGAAVVAVRPYLFHPEFTPLNLKITRSSSLHMAGLIKVINGNLSYFFFYFHREN